MTAIAEGALDLLPQRHTPCLDRLTAARHWDATLAVRVGRRIAGVRTTGANRDEVEQLLRDRRAPEYDDRVAPNFSCELAPAKAAAKGLNLVYRDHVIMARRRDPDAVLEDLVSLLDAAGHTEAVDHLAVRSSAVLVDEATVMLLPPLWHKALLLQQQRLAGVGLEVAVADVHLVTTDAELVWANGTERARRRLPISTWALRIDDGRDRALRAAHAVHVGFFCVENLAARGPRKTLADLAAITTHATVVGLRARESRDQVAAARELACSPRSATTG